MAGVPSSIDIHLRDAFRNRLETGGRYLEMAALGVAGRYRAYAFIFPCSSAAPNARLVVCVCLCTVGDWGTIEPFGTLPGVANEYYYKGVCG